MNVFLLVSWRGRSADCDGRKIRMTVCSPLYHDTLGLLERRCWISGNSPFMYWIGCMESVNFYMDSKRLIWLSKDASSFFAMIERVCWVDILSIMLLLCINTIFFTICPVGRLFSLCKSQPGQSLWCQPNHVCAALSWLLPLQKVFKHPVN